MLCVFVFLRDQRCLESDLASRNCFYPLRNRNLKLFLFGQVYAHFLKFVPKLRISNWVLRNSTMFVKLFEKSTEVIQNIHSQKVSAILSLVLFSQAPKTTWAPGNRCARSGTNGQAVVRSVQNYHERFRRCLKPQINIYLRQRLFLTLKKIWNKIWFLLKKSSLWSVRSQKDESPFFHRFDIAVHADPWEPKNTLMCQLWHVGRLQVND